MKALIFNSGLGKRMGSLTENNHKSMVNLFNGESIFERQIRILRENGIKDFVITTGPYEEQLISVTRKKQFSDCNFTFVKNSVYDSTNYIYSMYLAKEFLKGDFLTLHGDLVFNSRLIQDLLADKRKNLGTVKFLAELPEKDFKARVIKNLIKEVSVNINDDDCYTFQPMYKLDFNTLSKWVENVSKFVESGKTGVYAENAFNEISDDVVIDSFEADQYYIEEVDNEADLNKVNSEVKYFDYREQSVIVKSNYDDFLINFLKQNNTQSIFVVAGKSFFTSTLCKILNNNKINYEHFYSFSSNPKLEEVLEGVKSFGESNADLIIASGGGSAIDVAKCIKLFSLNYGSDNKNYKKPDVNLLAIPTTAGTGSESTKFAVVYEDGKKISICHDSMMPENVILDKESLKSLPDYHKKSSLLDAMCQAIESMWSVNSTAESINYSTKSLKIILKNIDQYFDNEDNAMEAMLIASNLSGKAINIAQTTAAHAMSYKLSSTCAIAHGHAAMLCLIEILKIMEENLNNCIDPRGVEYLKNIFGLINKIFNTNSLVETSIYLENMLNGFNLRLNNTNLTENELQDLVSSVNAERLKNNPININDEIPNLYHKIVKFQKKKLGRL